MQVRLDDRWVRVLASGPETGMGYQQVVVTLRNGRRVPSVLVFNAELLDWPDNQAPIQSNDIVGILLQSPSALSPDTER